MSDGGEARCVRLATDADFRAQQHAHVPVFSRGEVSDLVDLSAARARGVQVLDLGDAWVPRLFSGGARRRDWRPHHYQTTFRSFANEAWPDGYQGERARRDRYLELYGVPPSLSVLRERFERARNMSCRADLDLSAIRAFGGVDRDEDGQLDAATDPSESLVPAVRRILRRYHAPELAALDRARLTTRDQQVIEEYEGRLAYRRGISAIQSRLRCDGHYEGEPSGAFDARTRAALAEFERRHRIYARGSLSGETLGALRLDPAELERRAVLRVLTERAMLDRGFIEDGSAVDASGAPASYRDADGRMRAVRNLERELQERIERDLGLRTVGEVRRFFEQVGDVDERCLVAFAGIPAPAYHSSDMDLFVEVDRGDVWYDFPFDAEGNAVAQPIERRPTVTLFVRLGAQSVPLARYGTTIGGWRILRRGERDVWEYKESPVGPRVWQQIVSAPVWIPPAGVPPAALVLQTRRTTDGELVREVNQNLVGPGYASAYGLVAAYHLRVDRREGRDDAVGVDEGIRTHGSGDYTSIWRRASLGCHRLHNHRAVRLFSFILDHRAHRRVGHRPASYRVPVRFEEFQHEIRIDETGYVFELTRAVPVQVLRGRVLGRLRRAPTQTFPVQEGAH